MDMAVLGLEVEIELGLIATFASHQTPDSACRKQE